MMKNWICNNIKIVVILGIIILIILVTIIIKANQKNNKEETNILSVNLESMENIKEKVNEAVTKCKEMYDLNDKQNFSVYFGIDLINSNFEYGIITVVSNAKDINFESSTAYNASGEKIEDMPETDADGENLVYEINSYQIEKNKTYIIKVSSYEDLNTYYYSLKINNEGDSTIKPICYSIGTNDINALSAEQM